MLQDLVPRYTVKDVRALICPTYVWCIQNKNYEYNIINNTIIKGREKSLASIVMYVCSIMYAGVW